MFANILHVAKIHEIYISKLEGYYLKQPSFGLRYANSAQKDFKGHVIIYFDKKSRTVNKVAYPRIIFCNTHKHEHTHKVDNRGLESLEYRESSGGIQSDNIFNVWTIFGG